MWSKSWTFSYLYFLLYIFKSPVTVFYFERSSSRRVVTQYNLALPGSLLKHNFLHFWFKSYSLSTTINIFYIRDSSSTKNKFYDRVQKRLPPPTPTPPHNTKRAQNYSNNCPLTNISKPSIFRQIV